jgi:hypothetical protein
MEMNKGLGVAVAGLITVGLSAAAVAAVQPTRVRGEISSIKGNSLDMKTYDGNTVALMLRSHTKFASVVPASLSAIKSSDFVGIGATGPESGLVALEVVIFPNSMRGTGEGHYPWSVPAAVARADTHQAEAPTGAPPVQGSMTNGTVTSVAPTTSAPPVQGTMTNGTVTGAAHQAVGEKLTISYSNGKKVNILIPANAPVVRFVPAQRSVLVPGAKAFAVATNPTGSSKLTANFVAVGKNGLMPPM